MAPHQPPLRIRHRPIWGALQLCIGLACFLWAIWAQEGRSVFGFLGLTQGFFGWTLLVHPAISITATELQIRTAFGGISKSYPLQQGVVVDGQALYIGTERVRYYAWLIHESDWERGLHYLQYLEQRGGRDMTKHLILED